MSLIRALRAFLGQRREAAGQPSAPPPAPAAANPSAMLKGSMPVHAVGDVLHPGGTLGPLAEALLSDSAPADPPLDAALAAAGFGNVPAWAAALWQPMRTHGITPGLRRAAFLATVAHESNGGRQLEEALSYSADRIAAVWPSRFASPDAARHLARAPAALAEAVYGGRMGNGPPGAGDGWRYRGRGLIQLTGRASYGEAAEALSLPLLANPHLAAEPEVAARIAAWWWASRGCNALAAAGDVQGWRRRVNGGLVGLDDVRRRYEAVLAV